MHKKRVDTIRLSFCANILYGNRKMQFFGQSTRKSCLSASRTTDNQYFIHRLSSFSSKVNFIKRCLDLICQKNSDFFKKVGVFLRYRAKNLFAFYHPIRKIFRFGLPRAEKVSLSPFLLSRNGEQIQSAIWCRRYGRRSRPDPEQCTCLR